MKLYYIIVSALFCSLLPVSAQIPMLGESISEPLYVKSTNQSQFPSAYSNQIQGGFHQVNTLADMLNISRRRLSIGMLVYIRSTDQTYRLGSMPSFTLDEADSLPATLLTDWILVPSLSNGGGNGGGVTCADPISYYLYYNTDIAPYYQSQGQDPRAAARGHRDGFGWKEGRQSCRPIPGITGLNAGGFWQESGMDITNTNLGMVGIGVTNPWLELTVGQFLGIDGILLFGNQNQMLTDPFGVYLIPNGTNNSQLRTRIGDDGNDSYSIGYSTGDYTTTTGWKPNMTVYANSNIDIGKESFIIDGTRQYYGKVNVYGSPYERTNGETSSTRNTTCSNASHTASEKYRMINGEREYHYCTITLASCGYVNAQGQCPNTQCRRYYEDMASGKCVFYDQNLGTRSWIKQPNRVGYNSITTAGKQIDRKFIPPLITNNDYVYSFTRDQGAPTPMIRDVEGFCFLTEVYTTTDNNVGGNERHQSALRVYIEGGIWKLEGISQGKFDGRGKARCMRYQ